MLFSSALSLKNVFNFSEIGVICYSFKIWILETNASVRFLIHPGSLSETKLFKNRIRKRNCFYSFILYLMHKVLRVRLPGQRWLSDYSNSNAKDMIFLKNTKN